MSAWFDIRSRFSRSDTTPEGSMAEAARARELAESSEIMLPSAGTDEPHEDEQNVKVVNMMFSRALVDAEVLEDRLMAANSNIHLVPEKERTRIDPESTWYLLWLSFIVLLASISFSTTIYYLAFYETFSSFHLAYIVEYVIDLFFLINYAIQLNTGFTSKQGTKIIRASAARKLYGLSFLGIADAVACLPLDIIQLGTGWAPAARALKLFRVFSLIKHIKVVQRSTVKPLIINSVGVFRLVLTWLLLPHVFACCRVLIATKVNPTMDDEWKDGTLHLADHHSTQYLQALYWCMGVMSGYADGTVPETTPQYLFTLAVLNIGLFTFAYTVGVIGTMGDAGSQASQEFQISVSAMQHFIARYHLPAELTKRVTDYFAHRWESIKSNEKELISAAELLDSLPPCVRYDAVECMTADALNKVPLFARVEEGFIHALTQKMEPLNTSIGETLVRQQEVCDGLYIVLKGRLDVTVAGRSVATLGPGSCVGEQSMLTGNPANATVTSLSFCELYMLRREPFEELSVKFADTFAGFKQAAKLEAKNAKKAAAARGMSRKQMTMNTPAPTKPGKADRKKLLGLFAVPIYPHSRTRAIWAAAVIFALTYDALFLPFKIVFIGNTVDSGLTILDAICDVILILDLMLGCVLAYTENGMLVDGLKDIRARYFRKSTFIPLACSAFPTSILLNLVHSGVDARIIQGLRVLRVVRLIPKLRADAISRQQPSNLEEILRRSRSSAFDLQFALHKLAPLLVLYIGLVHYVACIYWALVMSIVPPDQTGGVTPTWSNQTLETISAGIADMSPSWMPTAPYLKYKEMITWYLRAMYVATVNLTGNGSSSYPAQVVPLIFNLFCFITGVMVFAYLTSAIVTLVMQADAAGVAFQQKNLALLGFMQDAKIDAAVIHRASRWMNEWWHAHGGVGLEEVIGHLPTALSIDIRAHIFVSCTESVPLWAPGKKGAVLRKREIIMIANSLQFHVFNADEWVLRKGMLNNDIFIITHGSADVLLDDGTSHEGGRRRRSMASSKLSNKSVAELSRGEVFGEHSAINKAKCEASVRARTSLELIALPRESMLKAIKKSPLLKSRFHAMMHKRHLENLYYKTGKVTVANAANAVLLLKMCIRRRVKRLREEKALNGGKSPTKTVTLSQARDLSC